MTRSGPRPTPRALADWLRITTAVFPGATIRLRAWWPVGQAVGVWPAPEIRELTAEALSHAILARARRHERRPAHRFAMYMVDVVQRGRVVADQNLFSAIKPAPAFSTRQARAWRATDQRMYLDGLLARLFELRATARTARATTDVRQRLLVTARAEMLARLLADVPARRFTTWIAKAPARDRPTLRALRRAGFELQAESATVAVCCCCGTYQNTHSAMRRFDYCTWPS